jgi:hypothetical protein
LEPISLGINVIEPKKHNRLGGQCENSHNRKKSS